MGIRGLTTFINERISGRPRGRSIQSRCPYPLQLEDILPEENLSPVTVSLPIFSNTSHTRILIDGLSFMNQLYVKSELDTVSGGDPEVKKKKKKKARFCHFVYVCCVMPYFTTFYFFFYLKSFMVVLHTFFWAMEELGIETAIVIDGLATQSKQNTMIKRSKQHIQKLVMARSISEFSWGSLPNDSRIGGGSGTLWTDCRPKNVLVDSMKSVARARRIPLIVADGEADDLLIYLARHEDAFIMSSDSDFFVTETPGYKYYGERQTISYLIYYQLLCSKKINFFLTFFLSKGSFQ